jgi:O-antigen ligase
LLLAALLISWCLTRQRLALAAGISALVIAAALAISAMLAAGALADLLPDNRVMDLIENRAEGSLSDRSEMLADAWKTLGEHPLLGHYASYKPGEYAHNILSAWIDLGIVGLTLLLLLLVLPLVDLGRQFAKRQRDVGFVGTITLLLLALLLLLAAKAFTYNLIPFALGAYAFDRTRRAARRPQ